MAFSEEVIQKVWEKAVIIPGKDKDVWRKDKCGATIKRNEYSDTSSSYGWEIDHIKPESKGGSNDLINLQPLHWENNRKKSDNYPNWNCAKTT